MKITDDVARVTLARPERELISVDETGILLHNSLQYR